uniref:Uncharacterized protein n=1 Tax=Pundamilia nyererei TaxID=303518 RepID=A0A3B4GA91_9CICH
ICCPETGSFQKLSSLHCSRDPAPAQGTMENSECPFLCACGLRTHRTMFLKTFIFCRTAALENGDEQIWGTRRALRTWVFHNMALWWRNGSDATVCCKCTPLCVCVCVCLESYIAVLLSEKQYPDALHVGAPV